MQKERIVIRKLKGLEPKELRAFKKRLQSSSHSKDSLNFFLMVIDGLLEGASDEPAPEQKYSVLSGVKLNALYVELHDRLKEFISDELAIGVKEREIWDVFLRMKFYNQRRLDEFYEKARNQLRKMLSAYGERNDFYFEMYVKQAQQESSYQERNKSSKDFLQSEADAIDQFYLWQKLAVSTEMLNLEKNIYNTSFEYNLLEEVRRYMSTRHQDERVINAYYLVLEQLLNPESRECFTRLKEYLIDSVTHIPADLAISFFNTLSNSARTIFSNRAEYYEELFDLYLIQIENKILFYQGYFPTRVFGNIVAVSLKVKSSEWTRAFIAKYQKYIPAKEKKVEVNYNLARCAFTERDFGECLILLDEIQKARFSDLFLNLARRRLLVKAYYLLDMKDEQYDVNQPDRAISALGKFLHQQKGKLSEAHARANLDFVRFVNRLLTANDEKRLVKLKKEIEETSLLPEKAWLLECLQK